MRVVVAAVAAVAAVIGWQPAAAWACGGLVAPNGTVRLLRTATLAAYHAGVEHYITSFEFAGGGAELGSIIPLPAVPTAVERGGDWTLQRLERETTPVTAGSGGAALGLGESSDDAAEVILETRIDALDLTVLKGGARAVGTWAKDHGFALSPDAPEVLSFYATRSPIFLAARFDAEAAKERGQQVGDGTPIHLTIPTKNPWVPLRILSLGRGAKEPIEADVYLLTPTRPALLPLGRPGVDVVHDEAATPSLLADLRSDKGMEWLPERMWLTKVAVATSGAGLPFDLAVDASGRKRPSYRDAGLPAPKPPPRPTTTTTVAPTTTAVPTTAAPLPIPDLALSPQPAAASNPWSLAIPVVLLGIAAASILWRRGRHDT